MRRKVVPHLPGSHLTTVAATNRIAQAVEPGASVFKIQSLLSFATDLPEATTWPRTIILQFSALVPGSKFGHI